MIHVYMVFTRKSTGSSIRIGYDSTQHEQQIDKAAVQTAARCFVENAFREMKDSGFRNEELTILEKW